MGCAMSISRTSGGTVRFGATGGGFTIVEMLVVVGVIALLMALILPALGGGREAARVAICANNLRQIGVANRAYATDSKLKTCLSIDKGTSLATTGVGVWTSFVGVPRYILYGHLYNHYLNQDTAVYYCPSSRIITAKDEQPKIGVPGEIANAAYYQRGANEDGPVSVRSVTANSAMISDLYMTSPGITATMGISHHAFVNVLYLDGAVKGIHVPLEWDGYFFKNGADHPGPGPSTGQPGAWSQLDNRDPGVFGYGS